MCATHGQHGGAPLQPLESPHGPPRYGHCCGRGEGQQGSTRTSRLCGFAMTCVKLFEPVVNSVKLASTLNISCVSCRSNVKGSCQNFQQDVTIYSSACHKSVCAGKEMHQAGIKSQSPEGLHES